MPEQPRHYSKIIGCQLAAELDDAGYTVLTKAEYYGLVANDRTKEPKLREYFSRLHERALKPAINGEVVG